MPTGKCTRPVWWRRSFADPSAISDAVPPDDHRYNSEKYQGGFLVGALHVTGVHLERAEKNCALLQRNECEEGGASDERRRDEREPFPPSHVAGTECATCRTQLSKNCLASAASWMNTAFSAFERSAAPVKL